MGDEDEVGSVREQTHGLLDVLQVSPPASGDCKYHLTNYNDTTTFFVQRVPDNRASLATENKCY